MSMTPDPHGQAALMLCESVLLLLVDQGVIQKEKAIDAIGGVIELKQEMAGVDERVVVSMASITLLRAITRSLALASGPDGPARP